MQISSIEATGRRYHGRRIAHSRITSELHMIPLNGDTPRVQMHISSEYDISNCDRVHHFYVSFLLS